VVLRLLRITRRILARRLIGRLRRTNRRPLLEVLGITARPIGRVSLACLRLVGVVGGVCQGFFRLCPLSAYATRPQVAILPNPAVMTSCVRISIEMFFDFCTSLYKVCRVPSAAG